MSYIPIYEKDLEDSLCNFDTIGLSEFNYSGVTYSGITLILDYNNFTSHFDTTGHTYSNIILNNDVYTYTGFTGETHYFTITDFYSGATPSIDPLLSGLTESAVISGFTTDIIPCTDILFYSGSCCPIQSTLSNLPWVCITNTGSGEDNCDEYIMRRPHNGWTLDFVFNRNNLPWSGGSVFFYTGVRDEYDPANYGDNNLSFAFTDDGRIKWTSYRYSGYCDTVSGYTDTYYVSSGQTPVLCTNGVSEDFNISIVFERYYSYSGCSLANEGGWNDLIVDSGYIEDNVYYSGTTEELNDKWLSEREKRLGKLTIYHNGVPIYRQPTRNTLSKAIDHSTDFEEIVLSDRGDQPFTHCVGGGVTGTLGLHEGVCCFDIKYAAYYEEPLPFIYIKELYNTVTSENYNIVECGDPCVDNLGSL